MRSLAASFVLVVSLIACSGPAKKKTEIGATEGSDTAGDTCCCKSSSLSSDDGKPVYENGGRMECSQKQGECVPEVQCAQQPAPE